MQDFSPTSAAELEAGTMLCGGRYRIERRVAGGGAATVYAATLLPNGSVVALKILNESCVHKRQFASRMRNEMQLGAGLQTVPNMVRPLDHGELPELDRRPYIAFELQAGHDLGSLPKPLHPLLACKIARSLADTLAHLHARGVVHRDVKPSNVLVDLDHGLRVRLIDLGYASSIGCGMLPDTRGLTAEIEVTGTLEYMAPEHVLGHPAAPSFDVYGLASTLWEMVLGTNPQSGRRQAEITRMLCDAKAPSLSAAGHPLALGIDAELVALIDRGLKKDVGERVASAAAFREALDGIVTRLEAARDGAGRSRIAGETETTPELPQRIDEARPAAEEVPPSETEQLTAGGQHQALQGPLALTPQPGADLETATPRTRTLELSVRSRLRRYAMLLGSIAGVALFSLAGARLSTDPAPVRAAAIAGNSLAIPFPILRIRGPEYRPDVSLRHGGAAETKVSEAAAGTGGAAPISPDVQSPGAREDDMQLLTARKRPSKIQRSPTAPAHLPTPEVSCSKVHKDIHQAKARGDWAAILEDTEHHRSCWESDARLRLRIRALRALGRYDECVEEGEHSSRLDIQRRVSSCRTLQE